MHEISHASSVQIESVQQHNYHCDPSDTIVETRTQRAHRGQSGNNLQAGQTSNYLQAEAPTAAVPPQLIMAAAPPANPVLQAPVFALGPGLDNTILDWSIRLLKRNSCVRTVRIQALCAVLLYQRPHKSN